LSIDTLGRGPQNSVWTSNKKVCFAELDDQNFVLKMLDIVWGWSQKVLQFFSRVVHTLNLVAAFEYK
jgi:hypothetical protein